MSNKRSPSALAAILFFAVSLSACEHREKTELPPQKDMPRNIDEVMKTHTGEIMAIPGVVGIYIGQLTDGKPCIKVMVREEDTSSRERIPEHLEGYPVLIEVTGEIRPLRP
jgi:hypothetical protein